MPSEARRAPAAAGGANGASCATGGATSAVGRPAGGFMPHHAPSIQSSIFPRHVLEMNLLGVYSQLYKSSILGK